MPAAVPDPRQRVVLTQHGDRCTLVSGAQFEGRLEVVCLASDIVTVVAERVGQSRMREDFLPVLLGMGVDVRADPDEVVLQSVDRFAGALLEGLTKFCRCHG